MYHLRDIPYIHAPVEDLLTLKYDKTSRRLLLGRRMTKAATTCCDKHATFAGKRADMDHVF